MLAIPKLSSRGEHEVSGWDVTLNLKSFGQLNGGGFSVLKKLV